MNLSGSNHRTSRLYRYYYFLFLQICLSTQASESKAQYIKSSLMFFARELEEKIESNNPTKKFIIFSPKIINLCKDNPSILTEPLFKGKSYLHLLAQAGEAKFLKIILSLPGINIDSPSKPSNKKNNTSLSPSFRSHEICYSGKNINLFHFHAQNYKNEDSTAIPAFMLSREFLDQVVQEGRNKFLRLSHQSTRLSQDFSTAIGSLSRLVAFESPVDNATSSWMQLLNSSDNTSP